LVLFPEEKEFWVFGEAKKTRAERERERQRDSGPYRYGGLVTLALIDGKNTIINYALIKLLESD
jgi:hypothetical protein